MFKLIAQALVSLSLLAGAGVAVAEHDPRDPDAVCANLAEVANSWAFYAMIGYPREIIMSRGFLTPEELEDRVPPIYRALVLRGQDKGLELVFGDAAKGVAPLSREKVGDAMYEWCLPKLPAPKAGEKL